MEVTDRFDAYIVEQITIFDISPHSLPQALPGAVAQYATGDVPDRRKAVKDSPVNIRLAFLTLLWLFGGE
jgi:hypothetical protein